MANNLKELTDYGITLASDGYDILTNGSAEPAIGLKYINDGIDIVTKLEELDTKNKKNEIEEKKVDISKEIDTKKFDFSKEIETKKFNLDKDIQERRLKLDESKLEFEKKSKLEFEKDIQERKLEIEESKIRTDKDIQKQKLEVDKDLQERRLKLEEDRLSFEKDIQKQRVEAENLKELNIQAEKEIQEKRLELEKERLNLDKDIQIERLRLDRDRLEFERKVQNDKVMDSQENRKADFKKGLIVAGVGGVAGILTAGVTVGIPALIGYLTTESKMEFAKEAFNGIFESEMEGILPFSGTKGRMLEKVFDKLIN